MRKKLILAGVAAVAVLGVGGLATAASASDTPTQRPGHSVEYDNRHQNGNEGLVNGNDVEVDADVPINVQIWDAIKDLDIF